MDSQRQKITRPAKHEYSNGKVIKTYGGPEVRLSGRYAFSPTFSIKAGYNSQRQYIHVLSNTAAMAPTDIWKLSDPNIKAAIWRPGITWLIQKFKIKHHRNFGGSLL